MQAYIKLHIDILSVVLYICIIRYKSSMATASLNSLVLLLCYIIFYAVSSFALYY